VRARALAKRIDAKLAIVDKRRERPGEAEVMNIIGDVDGHRCILFDDIVDSGGTLCNAAEALMQMGAESVVAYITHGVLSGGAVARITASMLTELVITDSIEATEAVKAAPNIRVTPISSLLGEAIARTVAGLGLKRNRLGHDLTSSAGRAAGPGRLNRTDSIPSSRR
jgi:ribose-phosphate pyrophosphokinase